MWVEKESRQLTDIGSYLFRFSVWDGWVSCRIIFNFARLIFVLSDILLHGLLIGTITRIESIEACQRLSIVNANSLFIILVSSGRCSLPICNVIFTGVVWIVTSIGLGSVSIRFVWNSCRRRKMFLLVYLNPEHNAMLMKSDLCKITRQSHWMTGKGTTRRSLEVYQISLTR